MLNTTRRHSSAPTHLRRVGSHQHAASTISTCGHLTGAFPLTHGHYPDSGRRRAVRRVSRFHYRGVMAMALLTTLVLGLLIWHLA